MKTQLLVATIDSDYAEHLSNILSEYHSDVIDVSVCGTPEYLKEQLLTRKYDIALLDAAMIEEGSLASIRLPLALWSENEHSSEIPDGIKRIRKYRRISSMVGEVLELYAKGLKSVSGAGSKRARVTAVWSPMGGVVKTTAALAYAERKTSEGKQALYLDLQPFSSVSAYFADSGRSISSVFEMIETEEGDVGMLIRSIWQQDSESGITYFCRPENFDDMNIIAPENISVLVDACSEMTDELVIDLSGSCDERTRTVLDLADKVLLVTDSSLIAQIKFSQFVSQNNVFERIKEKTILVANKGAAFSKSLVDAVVHLPLVQSTDSATVFKTLSTISFEV